MSKSDIAVSVREFGAGRRPELIAQPSASGDITATVDSSNHASLGVTGKYSLRHIPELDGVRGVAVLMVLAHHLFTVDASKYPRPVAACFHLMETGWLGVDLFFVLSGFLITRILLQAKNSPNYFTNFYARRTLRIFPLYFGVLIIAALCKVLDHNQIYLWTYTTNFKIAADRSWVTFSRSNAAAFGYFWSLAIEEHFYLFWPLIVYFCPRKLLIPTALMATLICGLARTVYVFRTGAILPAHVLTPFRIDTLLLGSVAGALTLTNPFNRRTNALATIYLLAITTVCVIGLYLYDGLRGNMRIVAGPGSTLTAVWFTAIIYFVATTKTKFNWLMRLRLLRLFGKYSYCIYIAQGFVIGVLSGYLLPYLTRLAGPGDTTVLIARLLSVPGCVLAAWVSWHAYEKQFLRLKIFFPNVPATGTA